MRKTFIHKTYFCPAIVAALLVLAMNTAQAERLGAVQTRLNIGSGAGAGKVHPYDLTGTHALNPQPLPPGLRRPRWF